MKRFKLVQVVSDSYLLDSLVGLEYSLRETQVIRGLPFYELEKDSLDALDVGERLPDADGDVWERVQ